MQKARLCHNADLRQVLSASSQIDLMQNFPTLDTVKMRVGALPTNISNALQYSLTWSTDGLINEYGNPCNAVENGEEVELHAIGRIGRN